MSQEIEEVEYDINIHGTESAKYILKLYSNIHFKEGDFVPSDEVKNFIINRFFELFFSSKNNYYVASNDKTSLYLFIKENIIFFLWNNFPSRRDVILDRIIFYYKYLNTSIKNPVYSDRDEPEDNYEIKNSLKNKIRCIIEKCFYALPDIRASGNTDETKQSIAEINKIHNFLTDIYGKRIHMNSLLELSEIDYLYKYENSERPSIKEFWRREGLANSTDTKFYITLWDKLGPKDREKDHISSCAFNAKKYPKEIIDFYIKSGRNQKAYVASGLADKFEELFLKKNKNAEDLELMKYYRENVLRFKKSNSKAVFLSLIRVSNEDEILFLTSNAIELGLKKALEKRMSDLKNNLD